jgi:tetratricopeptide (TPR) repeat protein
MWQDVIDSNIVAYQSAVALNQRMHLPEGREDFHTLAWLLYGNMMLGKFDEAKKELELARAADERNPTSRPVHQGYLVMRARYIMETTQWEKIPVEPSAAASAGEGMDYARGADSGTWTFIAGLCAVKLNDLGTADKAAAQLNTMRDRAEVRGDLFSSKQFAIMEREIRAVVALARGQKDEAVRIAKSAADLDITMAPPFGPPEPIKPAVELYGDVLVEAGRPKEAVTAYEQALLRTPNRTPTVKSLARAKEMQATQY